MGNTYARSMLLKRALQTCMFGFAFNAMSRISVPICSPSRSQSVQMNSIFAYRACASMLLATTFLSCESVSQEGLACGIFTNLCDFGLDRGFKKCLGLTRMPLLESITEVLCNDVSSNASEGYGTLSPGIEAEVELVVLHPRNATNSFLASN